MNIKLVDNWRSFLKMYSVWVYIFIGAMGAWQIVSPLVSSALPDWLLGVMVMLTALAGIAARLIKQFEDSDSIITPDLLDMLERRGREIAAQAAATKAR